MRKPRLTKKTVRATAVDLFCGAGGLTHGLLNAGIQVTNGYDIDDTCQYPYERNNSPATFHNESVSELTGGQLLKHYPKGHIRILVGCAPCVTFSKYTQGINNSNNPKWSLLGEYARIVRELQPDIVSMENVPELQRHGIFDIFLQSLKDGGYHFSEDLGKQIVYCPDYGIAQQRNRLVILASKIGPIEIIPPTHRPSKYRTVHDVIGTLPKLKSGEVDSKDPMHRASRLSNINIRRIKHSKPGGTWQDWPQNLIAKCHKNKTGHGYKSVYGRMEWDIPSPTITTQFYGFGNGRFGHPEQDRAISLREGAMLQSFPKRYKFVPPGSDYSIKNIGRMVGNAVPVRLGKIIGKTILLHVEEHYGR